MPGGLEKTLSTMHSPQLPERKNGDSEQILDTIAQDLQDKGNVGLHEFDIAKRSGIPVGLEESRRIACKIDKWMLPMLCLCQGLSIVDKTAYVGIVNLSFLSLMVTFSLNYGNLYGMQAQLQLSGSQFDWYASIYYFGYLLGNYPDSWLLQQYPSGKVLAIMTLIWGVILITTPACVSYAGLMTNRFFLGVVEAVVTPGMTILTSVWYTQTEVPFRVVTWVSFNGWAGIFGGFIAYGVGHISHPAIDLWRYIFLILGAVTIIYAFFLWFWFADSPVDAHFLNAEEKVLAIKRVAESKIGVKNRHFKKYQAQQALLDPKTWILLVATIAAQIPSGILMNFSTILIKGMGFTVLQTTLLGVASSGVQIVTLLISGYICMRFRNMRIITMTATNIASIIAAACLTYLPSSQQWNRLISFWFTGFEMAAFSLSLSMITSNVGGFTKKTVTTAIVFVGKAIMISFVIKAVAHLALGIYMLWSNIKRDREQGKIVSYEDQLKGEEAGMHDLTEFENKYHRYAL
ncbi:MFS general substrate transporter [Dichomitus squalens]|nr:MFS general substrate transporter [Dichomitus squalens]